MVEPPLPWTGKLVRSVPRPHTRKAKLIRGPLCRFHKVLASGDAWAPLNCCIKRSDATCNVTCRSRRESQVGMILFKFTRLTTLRCL